MRHCNTLILCSLVCLLVETHAQPLRKPAPCATKIRPRGLVGSSRRPAPAVDGNTETTYYSRSQQGHFLKFRVPQTVPLCSMRVYWSPDTPANVPVSIFVQEDKNGVPNIIKIARTTPGEWMDVKLNQVTGATYIGIMIRNTLRDNTRVARVGVSEFEVRTTAKARDPCPIGPNGSVCSARGYCGPGGVCRCDVGYFGRACGGEMEELQGRTNCPFYRDLPCAGHGDCNSLLRCHCHSDREHGYWRGDNCAQCQPGWYGPTCKNQCSPSADNPCNGNGVCSDGVTGNGRCSCELGWRGSAASELIPRTSRLKLMDDCSIRTDRLDCLFICERGSCDAFGRCNCFSGWGGPICNIQCPLGDGRSCGGVDHGSCSAIDGTCECEPAWTGHNCMIPVDNAVCRTGTNGQLCNGNGICASGKCRCNLNYAGDNCIRCAAGWTGFNCETRIIEDACPTFNSVTCNGRGVCAREDGLTGIGVCTCLGKFDDIACQRCEQFWGGPECTIPLAGDCPRINDVRCGGKGTCVGDRCICMGNYDGTDCTRCKEGWAGNDCNTPLGRFCSLANGLPCGGPLRGRCNGNRCSCLGNFDGTACQRCAPKWTGVNCNTRILLECGTASNGAVCSGKGICLVGRGCECLFNFDGPTCDSCLAGWTGAQCNLGEGCPATPDFGVCGGEHRGECKNNRCECEDRFVGPGCMQCIAGRAGDDCQFSLQGECGIYNGQLCSGRGTCDFSVGCTCGGNYDGIACQKCAPGWTGEGCSSRTLACPVFDNRECGGPARGSCVSGTCQCFGNRAGDACEICQPNWTGPTCARNICPVNPDSGLMCSGLGSGSCVFDQCQCFGNYGGLDCGSCAPGWTGRNCQTLIGNCPFASFEECGGPTRGLCNQNTFKCECVAPFIGDACDQCPVDREGPRCVRKTCPVGNNGLICSGRGECMQSQLGVFTCSCTMDNVPEGFQICDGACRLCDADALASCGTGSGRFGPSCFLCPGAEFGPSNICSGRGTCNDGRFGDGSCVCDPFSGFFGPVCSTPNQISDFRDELIEEGVDFTLHSNDADADADADADDQSEPTEGNNTAGNEGEGAQ